MKYTPVDYNKLSISKTERVSENRPCEIKEIKHLASVISREYIS